MSKIKELRRTFLEFRRRKALLFGLKYEVHIEHGFIILFRIHQQSDEWTEHNKANTKREKMTELAIINIDCIWHMIMMCILLTK